MSEFQNSEIPFHLSPGGTVTFIFMDIEGSTQILNKLRERYAELLSIMRGIVRDIIAEWKGHEMGTEGDSFFVVFTRATDAVQAAIKIQHKIADQNWPGNVQVKLRVGIHTGEPWVDDVGYTGLDVHRTARITSLGHGGQILLSETTTTLVRNDLPDGVSLIDLGLYRLKDFETPEYIRQLVIRELVSEFPPLNSPDELSSIQISTSTLEAQTHELDQIDAYTPKKPFDYTLRVRTLGGLRITLGNKLVNKFTSPKVEALLVFLCCNQSPIKRTRLSELFWENRSQSQSQINLKLALNNLHKVLGDYLTITENNAGINPKADVWVDIKELDHTLAENRIEDAANLYRGDFLEGFQIRSARLFENWSLQQRKKYRKIFQEITVQDQSKK